MGRKIKSKLKLITMLILIILTYFNSDTISNQIDKYSNINISDLKISKNNFQIDNSNIIYNKKENLSSGINLAFCPSNNCFNLLYKSFDQAKSQIYCAFYELDNSNLIEELKNKSKNKIDVQLIIDDKYIKRDSLKPLVNSNIKIFSDINRGTRYNNYMHNKFCVIDNKYIISGSTNPTDNGIFKNNNNIIKFESRYLAQNYKNEFLQMSSNVYGTNKKSVLKYNNITLNYKNQSYLVSSYMCPEDKCMDQIINEIEKAKTQIQFAAFAITNDNLRDKLLSESNKNINITGIIEKRNMNLKGSDFKILNKSKINMYLDKNKYNMHNKFFIIDEKTIITGSMNPSNSGANYNDENILIIKNKKIAKLFKKDFLELIN